MRRTLILFLAAPILAAAYLVLPTDDDRHRTWESYQGDPHRSQYSTLDQINKQNVDRLEVAWIYRSGGADTVEDRTQIQTNPIIVDGILYATSPQIHLFALDAATGREIWRFNPFREGEGPGHLGVSRGVMFWRDREEQRVLFTAGDRLFSIDAATGLPDPGFRGEGWVDLHEGLGDGVDDLFVSSNTPGAIYEDIVILGTRVSEQSDAAPGHIRAWNVRTGELAWVFKTIPHPGEFGYETWPEDAWTYVGAANSWAGMSLDPERGVVYIPTGSPAFDFYGGNRLGQNLFGNSVLALNAETGERIWHFQIVHHDLWDRDPPAPPNLMTVTHDGRKVDAVAQITKSGHVFLFDRDTGEPLFPIVETPVPASDIPGEEAWPTQPLPLKPEPFARQYLSRNDLNRLSPEYEDIVKRFMQMRSGGQYVPPSIEGTIVFPGFDGGGEWGGAAHDPDGILYVNSNEMPWILTLFEAESTGRITEGVRGADLYAMNCASCHGLDRRGDRTGFYPSLIDVEQRLTRDEVRGILEHGRGIMPSFARLTTGEKEQIVAFLFGDEAPADSEEATPIRTGRPIPTVRFAHTGYHRFVDSLGYPAVKPPWGTMNAIDMNKGEILWQVPLGELPELKARGIPRTGLENYGGPVVTEGGLIFIGATRDEMFRALDRATGEVLWETKLPAGGYATPATYEIDGRQYVVIAAGGGKMGTKSGDAYVAFALPE